MRRNDYVYQLEIGDVGIINFVGGKGRMVIAAGIRIMFEEEESMTP